MPIDRSAGNGKAPMTSPNYREEAERIVAEERAQTEKMPVYEVRSSAVHDTSLLTSLKGLEDYRLLEKMGDGAFSNVYKALEKKTGRKVAVKVVRKYELNSSQVRNRFPPSVYIFCPRYPLLPVRWPRRDQGGGYLCISCLFLHVSPIPIDNQVRTYRLTQC